MTVESGTELQARNGGGPMLDGAVLLAAVGLAWLCGAAVGTVPARGVRDWPDRHDRAPTRIAAQRWAQARAMASAHLPPRQHAP
jgi:hypothetical protein